MSDLVSSTDDENFHNDIIDADLPALVDFWAPWCGPCKMLQPVLEKLAEEFSDRLKVVKINVDENPKLPAKYGVRGIPALIIFKSGEEVERHVGTVTYAQLKEIVEKHC